MTKLKLLTQNIYWKDILKLNKRLGAIKKCVDSHSCDFVFLQEIIFYYYLNKLNKNFHMIYNYGRLGPRGGLVILSKNKPDSVEFHKFKDQGAIISKQITDRIVEKGFLIARFGQVSIVNTHLLCSYLKKENHKNYRHLENQFNELFYFLRREIVRGQEVLLAGDLNFTSISPSYKRLVSFLKDHTRPIKHELRVEKDREENIDYIFTSNSYFGKPKKIEYPHFVSDHPGVYLELDLSNFSNQQL